MFDFFKRIPLFEGLDQTDLERLCTLISDVHVPAGEMLFTEGSLGDQAYVIKEGQVEILKSVAGREVLLAVRGPGEVIGEMSMLEAVPRNASGRARTDTILVAISHAQLDKLLNESPSAARTMLHTVITRLKSTELVLQQSEKMAQLGVLTAGIAHEINNPVAAVQRGAGQLKKAVEQYSNAQSQLEQLNMTAEQLSLLHPYLHSENHISQRLSDWDAIARSDRISELGDWLEEHHIDDGWDLAPALLDMGFRTLDLDRLLEAFDESQFPCIVFWLAARSNLFNIVDEIHLGATRVSEIVSALKSYVYLDQGPVQKIDLHEGLENTLIILRSKIGDGIRLRREYSVDVPEISAFGSELNQVWTNIIANAVEAMQGQGEIILRTQYENDWVVVEIVDNGPGIQADLLPNIFNPFFTTKPVGVGTGLGLSISYNIIQKHGGEMRVFSQPGETCFQVLLPTN